MSIRADEEGRAEASFSLSREARGGEVDREGDLGAGGMDVDGLAEEHAEDGGQRRGEGCEAERRASARFRASLRVGADGRKLRQPLPAGGCGS